MAAPQLEHLFTLTAATNMTGMIAGGPMGTRVIVDASSGTFEGPKLTGTVSGPGGDWVTALADGSLRLDVRILLKTADGADILMEYQGRSPDGGKHITTAPFFQTGDERYTWLNNAVCVATGGTIDGGVRYEIYQVVAES